MAVWLLGSLITHHTAQAETPDEEVSTPSVIRSRSFVVHTDLPPDQATRLLTRLESMLEMISAYWGRPMQGMIECYVVRDIDRFPVTGMDPIGVMAIRTVGGMNVMRTVTDGRRYLAKSIVYANERPEVVLHEVVHAYCHHSFGRLGPVWYYEGMAEMGHYWEDGNTTVRADLRAIKHLRENSQVLLADVISPHQVSGDSWQNYASRWGLCHFLSHSPNYSRQFSLFGRSLLMGRDVTFEQTYGSVADQLSFEYEFFLRHIETGYSVERTAWNWNGKFATVRSGRTVSSTILAGRGWQPSGLTVQSGLRYGYVSSGMCSIGRGAANVDADGDDRGRGRLVGALLKNYQLGDEFDLGKSGAFRASSSGDLYLRCRNGWSELVADSGHLSVELQLQQPGRGE